MEKISLLMLLGACATNLCTHSSIFSVVSYWRHWTCTEITNYMYLVLLLNGCWKVEMPIFGEYIAQSWAIPSPASDHQCTCTYSPLGIHFPCLLFLLANTNPTSSTMITTMRISAAAPPATDPAMIATELSSALLMPPVAAVGVSEVEVVAVSMVAVSVVAVSVVAVSVVARLQSACTKWILSRSPHKSQLDLRCNPRHTYTHG